MANLQTTTITGVLTVTGNMVQGTNSDISPWYKLSIPSGAEQYVHVRTPFPADASAGIGWNPTLLEIQGYHGSFSDNMYDIFAVVNVTGDGNNTWYGSQIMRNDGSAGVSPFVYRSGSTYGGYTRVCFSVAKMTQSRTGYLWVRWWNSSNFWNSFAWAIANSSSSTGVY